MGRQWPDATGRAVRLRTVLVTADERRAVAVRRGEIRLETDPSPEGRIERVEDV